MADTPEQNAGAREAPDEVTNQTQAVAAAGPEAAPSPPSAAEAPTLVQTAVAAPPDTTPPAPPAAGGGTHKRPWWHYAVGAAATAAILIGVFLGGVAVGKDSGPDIGGHRGFEQTMPGDGHSGGQMPYGQGGDGWSDSGTSPHGWGQQGRHDGDEDGGHWDGQQPGQPGTPSPAPSVQTQ